MVKLKQPGQGSNLHDSDSPNSGAREFLGVSFFRNPNVGFTHKCIEEVLQKLKKFLNRSIAQKSRRIERPVPVNEKSGKWKAWWMEISTS